MVWIPRLLQFPPGCFAKEQKVPNGKRPHLCRGFPPGIRVCTLSGFSKSEAILASSLLVRKCPTFTVNPSSLVDLVLNLAVRSGYGIRIEQGCARHIQETPHQWKRIPPPGHKSLHNRLKGHGILCITGENHRAPPPARGIS